MNRSDILPGLYRAHDLISHLADCVSIDEKTRKEAAYQACILAAQNILGAEIVRLINQQQETSDHDQ